MYSNNINLLIVIQVDMLTQEAAIHQIHEAKSMVEEDLQHKLEEFEDEREHLLKLAKTATTLERELDQVTKCSHTLPHLSFVVCSSIQDLTL